MSTDPRFPSALAGRFRPERLIAEGGFGAVWLARQVALDRPVALKVLHAQHADSADAVKRFEDEARLTSRIQHPAVVTLLDHGVADGVPWMAFELIEGTSLRAWVDRGPSPWRDVLTAGLQVAQALEHARQHGVIHRDIKPDNILQSGPAEFKVADFGIAKWVGATVKTATGVILGTPAYISPTQIKGHLPEHRSDLYALGVTLFELLVGRTPFMEDNPVLLLERHLTSAPPLVSDFVSGVPRSVTRLIDRLLSKEREERFDTAGQVAAAIASVLDGTARSEPVSRPTARVHASKSTPVATRRWMGVAAGLALAALAGVVAFRVRPAPVAPVVVPSPSAIASSSPVPAPAEDVARAWQLASRLIRAGRELSAIAAQTHDFAAIAAGLDPKALGRLTSSAEVSARAIRDVLLESRSLRGDAAGVLLVAEATGPTLCNVLAKLADQAEGEGIATGRDRSLISSAFVGRCREIRTAIEGGLPEPLGGCLQRSLLPALSTQLKDPRFRLDRTLQSACAAQALAALEASPAGGTPAGRIARAGLIARTYAGVWTRAEQGDPSAKQEILAIERRALVLAEEIVADVRRDPRLAQAAESPMALLELCESALMHRVAADHTRGIRLLVDLVAAFGPTWAGDANLSKWAVRGIDHAEKAAAAASIPVSKELYERIRAKARAQEAAVR